MKVLLDMITREIAGETILVPVGASAIKYNGLITLNEVGAFLWARLPGAADEAALVDAVLEEYEVSREEASSDVAEFIAQLKELKIVE